MRATVIGGGSWGTALAHLLAGKGCAVTILMRDAALADSLTARHENSRYLPGLPLHPALKAVTCPATALSEADLCVLAVPCQHLRTALRALGPYIPAACPLICASKGIEQKNLITMSQVLAEELPAFAARYAILSGPSFAREVVLGMPTAVVLGCADAELGQTLREAFSTAFFRVYSSQDVLGVELGGAVKNVMAIAVGIADGLAFGANARAALITRGLAEISRLGVALGAQQVTFMGLSGMGDLVLTCTGDLSRNRQVGLRLGAGESITQITGGMRMVAEGVSTTEAVTALAARLGIPLPVSCMVRDILAGTMDPKEAVTTLMSRDLKEE